MSVFLFYIAGTTNNDLGLLCVGMCPEMRPAGVKKIGQTVTCVKLAICPDHPHGSL